MNSWRKRLRKMEQFMHPGNSSPSEGNCGLGVPVPFAQAQAFWGRQCPVHGHHCWKRESARELAEAAMLLDALHRERREGLPAGSLNPDPPPPAWIQEARELILNDGIEEYVEDR
jgi:hypothetical protein